MTALAGGRGRLDRRVSRCNWSNKEWAGLHPQDDVKVEMAEIETGRIETETETGTKIETETEIAADRDRRKKETENDRDQEIEMMIGEALRAQLRHRKRPMQATIHQPERSESLSQ